MYFSLYSTWTPPTASCEEWTDAYGYVIDRCREYGPSTAHIPNHDWRLAAGFLGTAMVLLWMSVLGTMLSFLCARHLRKAIRIAVDLGCLFILVTLFL